jgi:hypothetical protein
MSDALALAGPLVGEPGNPRIARRTLADSLLRADDLGQAIPMLYDEMAADESAAEWIRSRASDLLTNGSLALAGNYAQALAELRWGTDRLPLRPLDEARPRPIHPTPVFLSALKLEHDIEQLTYLQGIGAIDGRASPIIAAHEAAYEQLSTQRSSTRVPIESWPDELLRATFNRLLHLRETPRVARALSDHWDGSEMQAQYQAAAPGLVVIDDFLTDEALDELNAFCLASTVWSENRYAFGRLGSFFPNGFNCPLLIQIAEELRAALPDILGHYPLRQIWGFKNRHVLPGDSTTHADFAAINVNFWITPDEANLNPGGCGLRVYDVDAPIAWTFETYNSRSDVIRPFLTNTGSTATVVPYRQNRAVIFNSDLFHGTEEITFQPGYENRRINVTMLYGNRENDVEHRELSTRRRPTVGRTNRPAWRSAAFTMRRRVGAR